MYPLECIGEGGWFKSKVKRIYDHRFYLLRFGKYRILGFGP